MTSLTKTVREIADLEEALRRHIASAAEEEKRLRADIRIRSEAVSMSIAGIDQEKVARAKKLVRITGRWEGAGADRESVVRDAVMQLATGRAQNQYHDLWRTYFGTKNYDGWRGQRSDHGYGYGPRHGYVVFSVGLTEECRARTRESLTDEEVEDMIYYIAHVERVQAAEDEAARRAERADP